MCPHINPLHKRKIGGFLPQYLYRMVRQKDGACDDDDDDDVYV
jgi:hypothetical protein